MRGPLQRYARWLHLDNPAGRVERGPNVGADGSTPIPGVTVVGEKLQAAPAGKPVQVSSTACSKVAPTASTDTM